MENYLPAIRLLNDAGYQVLLTGDLLLDSSLYRQFGGMLVDARSLEVNRQWFSLYAAIETDIFVGECGGGINFTFINETPTLVLNAFPYYHGYGDSWMFYKTVRDQDGKLVHFRERFLHHAHDYTIHGMSIHNNSSEEIAEGVKSFVEDVRSGQPDPNRHLVEGLPDHVWAKHARSRLSPAWLRLYDSPSHSPILQDGAGANIPQLPLMT